MNVLLPVDGSDRALHAVRHVLRMVEQGLRVSAVLANVQEPATLYEMVVAHDPGVLERVSAEAGEHALAGARALLEEAGVPLACVVRQGDAAEVLLDLIDDFACELVVMGASGTSGWRRAILGSVSHELLHAAPVPVMIVKAPQDDVAAGEAADA